jgi:hypothetical protein
MRCLCIALIAAVIATSAVHAAIVPMAARPVPSTSSAGWLQLADARGYHHCHNTPRRIRCHRSEWIPGLWLSRTNAFAAATSQGLRREPRRARRHARTVGCK